MSPVDTRIIRATIGSLVAVIAACDNTPNRAESAAVVRDSAGVTIVENPKVAAEGSARWVVDSVPTMSLGDETGNPAYELTLIGSVVRLPNGMLLVLNGAGESAFEFRFYDSTGKHLATHGKRGEGPGDYRWINFVGSVGGDTVIAVDFPNRRLNWVSASKGYLRSIPIDETLLSRMIGGQGRSFSEGMIPLSDSVYAVQSWHGSFRDPNRHVEFHIVDLSTKTSLTLGQITEGRYMAGPFAMHVVDRDRRRMCLARTTAAEISCIDAGGKRRIIRWNADSIAFTPDDRHRVEARMRAIASRNPVAIAEMEKRIAEVAWPQAYPPIQALQLDALGNFWVVEPRRSESDSVMYRIRVLDPEGRHLAFVNYVPMRSVGLGSRQFIEGDRMLRVYTDENDLPRIGSFSIRKNP